MRFRASYINTTAFAEMEEDVLNALQTRTAYLPSGYDRAGKIIIVVNIINDLQLWNRRCLELSIAYLKSALR